MSEHSAAPILIAGPTASGKSSFALAIAERFGGAVINADSMQVYRELRILTARPTIEDEARAPHRLYGFVPACEAYSAGRFAEDAVAAIAAVTAEGLRPVIVGGTGLYFKVLLEGLSPIPAIPPDVRAHWRGEAQRHGSVELHRILCGSDPVMAARLAPSDTQRIVRALEVLEATGQSLSSWQRQRGTPVVDEGHAIRLAVQVDRKELARLAEARFDTMLKAGALDEARALAALDLDPALPAMRAIGVRPLIEVARGHLSLADAAAAANAETRQYIKRQQTWIKRNMVSWKHISAQEMQSNARDLFAFVQNYR